MYACDFGRCGDVRIRQLPSGYTYIYCLSKFEFVWYRVFYFSGKPLAHGIRITFSFSCFADRYGELLEHIVAIQIYIHLRFISF